MRRLFSVYTRTGDKGTSGLFNNGKRLSKDHAVYDALGSIDELSSHIGHANVQNDINLPLCTIQSTLQDINSHLADPENLAKADFCESSLEEWIDNKWREMPGLKRFILPSGGELATRLHIARTVCRRSERCLVTLSTQSPWTIEHCSSSQRYLNRLSDWLFVAARYAAFKKDIQVDVKK